VENQEKHAENQENPVRNQEKPVGNVSRDVMVGKRTQTDLAFLQTEWLI
jgi:hypothetical protein